MAKKKKPSADDLCAFCNHKRSDHNPPKKIEIAKTGSTSGKAVYKPNLTPTHCYSNPLCCCLEFKE